MSFRRNHVPPTREEIRELLVNPPVLLSRLSLRLDVFDTQVRAELWQGRRMAEFSTHLVWQHRAPIPASTDSSALLATHYMGETAEHLANHGWPGVSF